MEEFVQKFLARKRWRLDNLYTIVDKQDRLITLKLNNAQEQIVAVQHPKTIILKSRQRGISTFKVAENLDKCLVNPNVSVGIASYGQVESKKLAKKALIMWQEFDPDIKELLDIKLTTSNQDGLSFSNGSQLRIGNFRGDTLSSLHVSELAKIAKKFPEKSEELQTGAFEAIATKSSISIESTAEGNSGMFYDMWNAAVGRVEQLVGKPFPLITHSEMEEVLTPLDFLPVFLSWTDDPDCSMADYYEATKLDKDYFDEVEEYTHKTLTQEQKNWVAAKRARLKNKFNQEYPYSPESAFNVVVEGTYYANQYEKMLEEKRLANHIPYNTQAPVFCALDLGMNDRMSLVFAQVINGQPRIIGEYSNTGFPISYYVDIMQQLPYPIDRVYLPHDANVRDLSTGRTRIEEFRRLGCRCTIVPKLSIQEGIEATRQLLDILVIDKDCSETINAIQTYRQKFDQRLQVFMGTPEHGPESHAADALRYLSLALSKHKVSGSEIKQGSYSSVTPPSYSGAAL